MINKILNNEKLPVYDHFSAIDLIIHKGRVGEVYNIGGICVFMVKPL